MSGRELAKVDERLPTQPISDLASLRQTWENLEKDANLITPISSVDSIPQLHAISLRSVVVDPETDKYGNGREVYRSHSFCAPNERALGGVALQKIAGAAGVEIVQRKRLDDRSSPYHCEIEITVQMRDYDGTLRTVTKAKEIDFRDGAPETMKPERVERNGRKEKTGKLVPLAPADLANKRAHIQSLAETKAFYRALRTLLAIKQKYTLEELKKPFVVPKLIPNLDERDPVQKQALIALATGKEDLLFGPARQLPPGEARELRDVTPDAEANAETSEPAAAPAFEPLEDLPTEQPPPAATCGCVCGCGVELTKEVARITKERCGGARCEDCYPGRGFDIERHREFADLELPAYPKGLTADQIEAGRKAAKK